MTLLWVFLAGACASACAAGVLLVRARSRVSVLEGMLQALQETDLRRETEWRARTDALDAALESTQEALSQTQQRLAASLARSQRVPELEQQVQDMETRLRLGVQERMAMSSQLAAREEQVRQIVPLQQELAAQRAQQERLGQEVSRLKTREQELVTTLAKERQLHEEKLALLQEAREALGQQFKVLADEILEQKTRRFTEQNQSNMQNLLGPLHERIAGFGKLVQETHEKDALGRLSLEQELRRLQAMNTRLNEDAIALTNALTGTSSKAQGTWGEMVLEKVLESSGLHKDREYRTQVSDVAEGENGLRRFQPDVVIDLPDNKQLVVDSKVSLNAYVRYAAATDEATRAASIREHVAAIRAHIRTLSEKRYQDLYQLRTLDFVFMFVPVEPAYLLAVQHDVALFNEAFERRIMIVGPSTLLATLRTVASIWRYEYQNRNAEEIARQSGAMYDKFVGFVESMEKLGRQLELGRDAWQESMKRLGSGSGNLISRAERLRKLGVRAGKVLPERLVDASGPEGEDEGTALPDPG